MTTRTSFSEKRSPNRRFFNSGYFRFRLKTGWPLLVVFIFVFILTMAVPTVSFITEQMYSVADGYATIEDVISDASEMLYTMGAWNVAASMFGGLLCGITTMRYTNNKVAVNFYHSLPMRREALFITSTLQSFLYYFIAFAGGLLFTFGTFAIRLGTVEGFIRPTVLTLLYGVLFFFLVYSMTLFAASLTGTGFMRFVGAGYVIFLPLAMFLLFIVTVGSCGIYYSILDIDYYMSNGILTALCSPLRFINLIGIGDGGGPIFNGVFNKDVLIVFLTAVAFYGLGFLLYCLRPSESASKPVIWKIAHGVFKYSSMFMGGTLFALLFYGMFESIPWMVFGIIIGSVIVFMAVNGILNKSARAIFKGIRGLCIYMAVMAVVTVVFYCDVFGLFSGIPNGSFVNRVEVCVDYTLSAEYSGDFASRVTKLIDDTVTKDESDFDDYNGGYYEKAEDIAVKEIVYDGDVSYEKTEDRNLYSGYYYRSMPLEVVFHTKIGVPYAVRVYPTCEAVYDLVNYMYNTGKVASELPDKEKLEHGYTEEYFENYADKGDNIIFNHINDIDSLYELAEMLSDPFGLKGESPVVGKICLYSEETETYSYYDGIGKYINLYIHANDIDVLNRMMYDKSRNFGSEEDVIDYYISHEGIEKLYVIDNNKAEMISVTDADVIREYIGASFALGNYYDNPVLCQCEHRYNVSIATPEDYEYSHDWLNFRKGEVPESVVKLLGE